MKIKQYHIKISRFFVQKLLNIRLQETGILANFDVVILLSEVPMSDTPQLLKQHVDTWKTEVFLPSSAYLDIVCLKEQIMNRQMELRRAHHSPQQ